jgi:hypothetical protein
MQFNEILAAQNLTEEQINAITAAMKENKIYTSAEENIDIRYNKLKEEKQAQDNEFQKAQELIKQLQDSAKGNEEIQNKIKEYEAQIEQLKTDAAKAKLDYAIKAGLLERNVNPDSIDYLLFKINQDNKELKLDENDKLQGIDFDELKTKYVPHFKAEDSNASKRLDPNSLPQGGEPNNEPKSLADALRQKFTKE